MNAVQKSIRQFAEELLSHESAALSSLQSKLDWKIVEAAITMLLGCEGTVLVTGIGTSSSIARRCAHILTCSGLPAVYLDPAQAQHGYSALIRPTDVVVAFSRGGETDEINHVLSIAYQVGAHSIAISEKTDSSMADLVDLLLNAHVSPEHDAGGIIPLASTLAHAAVGDILCAAVMKERGLSEQAFTEHHPGGAVGKQLAGKLDNAADRPKQMDDTPMDLKRLGGFVLDMDGVLWHGEQALPGVTEFFEYMQDESIKIVLATNNPSKRPSEFAQKARSFGLPVDAEQIVTSSVATVDYLKDTYPQGTRIHVIGEQALKELVAEAGYELADQDVSAVVAALERDMTYETIKRGVLLIRGGAEFIGTNGDPAYPSEEGFIPGSGMMVTALAASSGQEPVIMGKPHRGIFDLAMQKLGLPVDQVASVGDRLDTDVVGGAQYGMRTVLLLTGIAQQKDLASSEIKPDWVFKDLPEFLAALRSK